jgi:hypothetical protein
LQFSGTDLVPIVKELPAEILLKVTLTVYYLCWVGGLLSDLGTQQHVYAEPPNKDEMPIEGYATMAFLLIVFGLLCLIRDFRWFAVLMTTFFAFNIASWVYLTRFVLAPVATRSKLEFSDRPLRLEKVHLVYDDYLCGRWQTLRFVGGAIILATLNALVFSPLGTIVSEQRGVSGELLWAGCVSAFVIFMEGWIWLWRLRVRTAIKLLEHLSQEYLQFAEP